MAKTDDKGNWLDPRGSAVAPKYVPKIEKRRDQLVEDLHKRIAKLSEQMRKTKSDCLQKIEDYLEWLEKETGTKREGKGNLALTSFSGDQQVEIRMDDVLAFDERLQNARALILEYVEEREASGDEDARELGQIARDAFNLDKSGSINVHMILKLTKRKFNHPKWIQAVELIRDSLQVIGTRQYLAFYMRPSGAGKWTRVELNLSAM